MFLKIKSLRQRIGNLFTNLKTVLLLGLGIALAAVGIGIAIWMSPVALFPIMIAAAGGFFGAFAVAAGLRRSAGFAGGDRAELEKATAAALAEQRRNHELTEQLTKVRQENETLHHRLETVANVTRIQPVMKLVTGELSFDVTDFCEKRLDGGSSQQHPLSRKFHETPEFYRGVYKYSGKMNLAADLAKINVVETEDTITICGPIEYDPLLDLDHEARWLMHGRREQEFRHGCAENDMETVEIKVTKIRDSELEDRQTAALHENLKNLKIIDSMKTFTDKIVVEFVKLMLAPTGKKITYSPTANEAFSTKTLGELVTAYNNRLPALLPTDSHTGETR